VAHNDDTDGTSPKFTLKQIRYHVRGLEEDHRVPKCDCFKLNRISRLKCASSTRRILCTKVLFAACSCRSRLQNIIHRRRVTQKRLRSASRGSDKTHSHEAFRGPLVGTVSIFAPYRMSFSTAVVPELKFWRLSGSRLYFP
jgi:hypothetical protein